MEGRGATAGRAEVLVVENDGRILELLAWFLERRGYRVRTATSFEEAERALEERRPDLLVSDLIVGDRSGRTELVRLAERDLLPPTLVVSGNLDPALVRELLAQPGVVGTLAKPFRFEVLEERLREALPSAPPSPQPGCAPT